MNKELIELRQVITKLVPLLTGKGLVVSQRGSQAYVAVNTHTKKPERVNIPNVPDNATPEFIRAIQGFIDHEVAHVLITNFDHYLVKDAHFNPKAKRLQNIVNQVEDTMIEREIVKIFPGSARNIRDLRIHYNNAISKPFVDEMRVLIAAGKRSEQDMFVGMLIIILRALAGHEEFQQFMDDETLWEMPLVKHFVNTLSPATKKALPHITSTKEARAIAEEVERILYPAAPPPVVSAVDPAEGHPKGGYEITIDGDNFVDVMGVSFGEKPCSKYKPMGKKQLVVLAPKGVEGEVVDVTVTTSHGSATLPGAFKYVTPPPPPPSPEKEKSDSDDGDEGEAGESSGEGESKDKPEKKAGKGSGDGERDHEEQEDGEGQESSGEAKKDADKDQDGEAGDDDEGEDEGGAEDKEDAGGAGDDTDDGDDDQGEDEEGGASGSNDDDSEQGDGSDDEDDAEKGDAGQGDGDDEDEAEASGDDDGDDEDDGDGSNGSSDDEEGESGEDESGAGGSGDDEDDDGEQKGDASSTTIGFDNRDSEAGDPSETGDDEEDNGGGGVGEGAGQSMFDLDDDAFDEADISRQVAILITQEAVREITAADYNVYTREFDRIEPLNIEDEKIPKNWVPNLEEETRQMTGKMQKDIERMLAAQSQVRNMAGYRSGRLHAPNLHRLIAGDDRIFFKREEHTSKDTAVTLLIDNSGSMKGSKVRTAMVGAYALATTLERVRIPHEILGFTTGDWNSLPYSINEAMREEMVNSGVRFQRTLPIIMPIYKSFDERINSEVKKRIAFTANAQRNLQGNIDGESLEYAAIRLSKRREKRKVIIVLSDGHPAGAEYADGHLKLTVEKLTKAGFDLVGIGIEDSAVRHFYPKSVVLNNVQQLPGEIMKELRTILQ
ncbi:IPT/TIG domain-containing protein [Mesorhizobium sp.]|uniref:cobaltochelatase CobT-related protein n=1 Tax=Mesorhizobium sp. TaxID=1871066 RepID=UPI000FE679B1|nr:IPT/TIG domain-containing protein [Mesorhizobium sp.]RWI35459.1 MAG: hypothetical protein EOR14_28570 [Mesorhizobium sp.]RWJ66372.1 MAG: hypothetical protein EOR34_28565 [Mesorhizobium sp.]